MSECSCQECNWRRAERMRERHVVGHVTPLAEPDLPSDMTKARHDLAEKLAETRAKLADSERELDLQRRDAVAARAEARAVAHDNAILLRERDDAQALCKQIAGERDAALRSVAEARSELDEYRTEVLRLHRKLEDMGGTR